MKKLFSFQVLFFLAFIIMLSTSFTVLYRLSRTSIEERQVENIQYEVESLNHEITLFFHDVRVTLNNVEHYMLTHGEDNLLTYMITVYENSENMASLYLGKPDQTMINATGFTPPDGFDLTQRYWYQEALNQDGLIYTPAFLNATEDRIIITVSKAVYDGETLLGVLAADIDITTISSQLKSANIGETGYAFMIDADHDMIGHPTWDEQTLQLRSVYDLYDGFDVSIPLGINDDIKLNGEPGVLHHSVLLNDAYHLYVFMPNEEFSQNVWAFFNSFMIIVGVFMAFSGLLAFMYLRYFIKPTNQLLMDVASLDIHSDMSKRLSLNEQKGFKNIRTSLNELLEDHETLFKKNKNYQHNLLLENQKVKRLMEYNADIVFEIDLDKRFVSVFGKGIEKINMTPKDVLGKTVTEAFGTSGQNRDEVYTQALKGEKCFYEWHHHTPKGTLYFESSISPIYDEHAEIVGAVGITRDVSEQREKQQKIEYLSKRDFLTGTYNRRYFSEAMARYDQSSYFPIGIMMIDLNGLKILNDAYGHDVGDQALKKISEVLKTAVHHPHILARIGGDEFAVLALKTSDEALYELKTKITDTIKTLSIKNVGLSVAIGYAHKENDDIAIHDVMQQAENYMYKSKLMDGKSARNDSIKAIFKTLTDKYEDEKRHSLRVSKLAYELAKALNLPPDMFNEVSITGLYHDIGKISIPDYILNKPGSLTEDEYEQVKKHTENGFQILRAADAYSDLAKHALYHHERYDGKGYPEQLKGDNIPFISRIISVVDAYEAMTSDRPYRKAMSKRDALNEIKRCAGTQFDANIAHTFINMMQDKTI